MSSLGNLQAVSGTGSGYWQIAAPDSSGLLLGGTNYTCPGGVRLGQFFGSNATFEDITSELPASWTKSGPCRDLETLSAGGGRALLVQAANTYQNTQVGLLDNGVFTNLTSQFNLYPCCHNYFSAYGNGTFLLVSTGSGYLYQPSTGLVTNVTSVLHATMSNGLGQAHFVQYYRGDFLIGFQYSLVDYNVTTNSVRTLFTVPAGGGQTGFITQGGNQTYLGVDNGSRTWVYNSTGGSFVLDTTFWGQLSDMEISGRAIVALGKGSSSLVGTLYEYVPSSTNIIISETGLPAGSHWSGRVDCSYVSSTGTQLTLTVPPNTSYFYQVSGPTSYSAFPRSGSVYATGPTVNISVQFTHISTTAATSTAWQSMGPQGILTGPGGTSTGQLNGPLCSSLATTGEVQAIAVDPQNPQIIYVSGGGWLINSPSGIDKTTNGGTTWSPVDKGLSDRLVNALWIDPSNPSVLLAGSLYTGIYRTADGGSDWTLVLSAYDVESFVSFNGEVFAATSGPQGVLMSQDGGQSWTYTWTGMTNLTTPIALATDGHILYASTGAQGVLGGSIYWTTNGRNWTKEPEVVGSITSIAVSRSNSSTLFAIIQASGAYTQAYLAVSHDRGNTWTNLTIPNGWPQPVATDPNFPSRLYAGIDGTYYISGNNGSTFTEGNLGGIDTRVIYPLVGHPGTIFIGGDQGIYETTNDGANWSSLAGNMTFSLAYTVAVHNTSLFASMQDFSPVDSLDGGASWSTTSGFEGGAVYVNPLNASYVYSLTGGGFYFSNNGGGSFTAVSIGVNGGNQNLNPIAVDPNDSLHVYVAGTPGVYVSHDGGSSFALEPWPFRSVMMVVVDPANNQTLYVSNATGAWISHDQGSSWSPITVPGGGIIWSLTVDPANPQIVVASTTNALSEVVRSTDGGHTFVVSESGVEWQPSPTGFSIRTVSFDPTGKYVAVATAVGIYLSTDGGVLWGDIAYNSTATYFTGVAWDQGYLYVSTYGEGILRLKVNTTQYYPVEFIESGLALTTPWYVSVLGNVQGSEAANMTFLLPNGTYPFSALPGGQWNSGEFYPENATGTVVVNGQSVSVVIRFLTLQSVTVNPSSLLCRTGQSVFVNATSWSTAGLPVTLGPRYTWSLTNYSLGTLNLTEGPNVLFNASSKAGNLTLYVNSTYNGWTVHSAPVQIQVRNDIYPVTFGETGLPGGTSWSVVLGGSTMSSTNTTISFLAFNGSHLWTLTPIAGYHANAYNGTAVVNGSGTTVSIVWTQTVYPVTFVETGLPPGTGWWVNLTNGQTFNSTTNSVAFKEPNGTYTYHLATIDKTYQSGGGSFTVNGGTVTAAVLFTQVTYLMTFTESGLPSGTQWWVNVTGQLPQNSTSTTITLSLANGSYAYGASAVNKAYQASGGSFTVNGAGGSETVTFSSATYTLTFAESGLPTGTSWYVNVTSGPGGFAVPLGSATGSTITLLLINGSYSYTVETSNKGYTTTRAGSLTESGGTPATVSVTFRPYLFAVTFTESGLPVGDQWYLNVSSGPSSGAISGGTPAYTLALMNGSYAYTVATNDKTYQSAGGAFTVNGTAVPMSVTFTHLTYLMTFTESGLPSGTEWWVNVSGQSAQGSTTPTITLLLANGSYTYTVSTTDKLYQGLGGNFIVNGTGNSQAITFLSVTYPVTLIESGLPAGDQWYVNVSSGPSSGAISGGTPAYTFDLMNGSYAYTVATNDKTYAATGGSFVTNGATLQVPITFAQVTYKLTLTETGLPAGAEWWTNVTGESPQSSTTSTITLMLTNGSYTYSISTADKTYQATGGGFTVNGIGVPESVLFTVVTYTVTFRESGLPPGTNWSVTLPGQNLSSTSSSLTFAEQNGSYDFTVTAPAGYVCAPGSGTLSISGKGVTQSIACTKKVTITPTYKLSFTESGLPAGVAWAMTVNGVTMTSTTTTITFLEPNGTYTYMVIVPQGYTVSPAYGSTSVNGQSTTLSVTFTTPTSGSNSNSPTEMDWALLVVPSLVAVAGLVVLWVLRGRGKPSGPSSSTDKKAESKTSE